MKGGGSAFSHISEIENYFTNNSKIEYSSDALLFIQNDYLIETFTAGIQRANNITQILNNYKRQQDQRNIFKMRKQTVIFRFMLSLVFILTAAFLTSIVMVFRYGDQFNIKELVGIITCCVTYLSSIFTIFLIIVKYIFPKNEEKNFNELVKVIVKDDTERMKSQYELLQSIKSVKRKK